jgi:hypothetical protein
MFLVSHLLPQFTSGCALKDASMKMLAALIRPERLPSVQMAIKIFKAELMRVTETRSCGRGEGYPLDFLRLMKVHLDIALATHTMVTHHDSIPHRSEVSRVKLHL